MNKPKRSKMLWVAVPVFCLAPLVRPQASSEGTDLQKREETFLRKARIVSIDKRSVGGRTTPWLVTLDDGKTVQRALFKYVNEQRPKPTPDSYRYELAAYELTKLLGVEIIPPVIEREVGGRKGSLQTFLENCIREKDRRRKKIEPPNPQALADALEDVKIIESLTLDECLDWDDTYVHRENWRVCRVDFGEAFFPSPELSKDCEITRCSRRLYQGLLRLKDEDLASTMRAYLNEEERDALLKRKNFIIEKIRKLIEEKGEDAVLF